MDDVSEETQHDLRKTCYANFQVWLKDIAEVQEDLKMLFGSAIDKRKFAPKAEKHKYTSFVSTSQEMSNQKGRVNVASPTAGIKYGIAINSGK